MARAYALPDPRVKRDQPESVRPDSMDPSDTQPMEEIFRPTPEPLPQPNPVPVRTADAAGDLNMLNQRIQREQPQGAPQRDPTQDALDLLNRRITNAPEEELQGLQTVPGAQGEVVTGRIPTYRGAQEQGMNYEPPGLLAKAWQRFMGSDIESDPQEWPRLGTTIAGSLGGGFEGARIPGPPVLKAAGAAAGAITGAYVGSRAPESLLNTLENAGFVKPGTALRWGLSEEELSTVAEGEALLEVATMGGVSLARGLTRGGASLFTGMDAAGRQLTEAARREGIAMLPVMIGDRQIARSFVSVMGRFPWVAGALKRRAQGTMNQIQGAFEGVPARFGPMTTFDEASASILRDNRAIVGEINTNYELGLKEVMDRAAFNGVKISPVNTRAHIDGLIGPKGLLTQEIPRDLSGNLLMNNAPPGAKETFEFLQGIARSTYEGVDLGNVPVRQVESLLATIDAKVVSMAGKTDNKNIARLEGLSQSLRADMLTKAISNTPAYPARQFVEEMNHLDHTMSLELDALRSTAAQKAGIRISQSGRSARVTDIRDADQIAQVILRTGSPQAVEELARIARPETMRQVGGAVMHKAVQGALIRDAAMNTQRFDADIFAKSLGLDDPLSGTYRQTQALLQYGGNAMQMQDLTRLVEVARVASRAEIPDVSTFVARGAVLGGIGKIGKYVAPWMIVGGTQAAAGTFTSLATVLGSRGISAMISDPKAARALRYVIAEESTQAVRRSAGIRATVGALNAMEHDGTITKEDRLQMLSDVNTLFQSIDDETRKLTRF